MLSIIVCSRNKALSDEFVSNVQNTVGLDHEIVAIDNSENKHTIFSAYNSGIEKSKYQYICLVHEDVFFHSQNWGEKVVTHLEEPQTGIIGIAGGGLVPRVPTSWATTSSTSINIIQSYSNGKKPTEYVLSPSGFHQSKRSAIILDGVFLCMRRELTTQVRFDETLYGFHGYDYDITLQAAMAGYTNYVIYDIKIEHFSGGRTDIVYFRNLINIFKKWERYLPLIDSTIPEDEKLNISEIERSKLLQLTKKMVRKGFEVDEIKHVIAYYGKIIKFERASKCLTFRVFFIRLFNCPKYLFKFMRTKSQPKLTPNQQV